MHTQFLSQFSMSGKISDLMLFNFFNYKINIDGLLSSKFPTPRKAPDVLALWNLNMQVPSQSCESRQALARKCSSFRSVNRHAMNIQIAEGANGESHNLPSLPR